MPHSEIHKKKRKKNFILLALIFTWCFLIYALSMVKMAHSHGIPNKYLTMRKAHQEEIDHLKETYDDEGALHQEEIEAALESWWYGELMSDQAKEIMTLKNGEQFEWETNEEYEKRINPQED